VASVRATHMLFGAAVAVAAIYATAGCGSVTSSIDVRASMAQVGASADPAATNHACAVAIKAAGETTKVLNDQYAALERAAAVGDENAMVSAAEVINSKFVEVARALAALAQPTVNPTVRRVLSQAAATLRYISSEAYPGGQVEIKKKLAELSSAFGRACA
jgi:hypothetical protein